MVQNVTGGFGHNAYDGDYEDYNYLLKIYAEITQEFATLKEVRNNVTDEAFTVIVDDIAELNTAMEEYDHSVHMLMGNLAGYKATVDTTLKHVQEFFQTSVNALNDLHRCGRISVQPGRTPNETSAEEAMHEIRGHHTHTEQDTTDHTGDHAGHKTSLPEDKISVVPELITPLRFSEAKLEALLGPQAVNTYVTLRDAVKAFIGVASRISQEHIERFLKKAAVIKEVMANIDALNKHRSHLLSDFSALEEVSKKLPKSVSDRATSLNNLTWRLNQGLSEMVCA